MSTAVFAKELRETIVALKNEEGITEINADNLISYLDRVIEGEGSSEFVDKERYKAELQLWVEKNKVSHSLEIEEFRAIIMQGQNALKTALIMNGGATIAILAFLGKLSDSAPSHIANFSTAMNVFICGIFFAGLSSGLTYLAQLLGSAKTESSYRNWKWLNALVIVMGLTSYGLFIYGAFITVEALTSITGM